MRNHTGWVSALGEAEGRVGDRPGGCGPEGAGAISQAPSFLGTKGDTPEQTWQNESLQGLEVQLSSQTERPGASASADSQRKERNANKWFSLSSRSLPPHPGCARSAFFSLFFIFPWVVAKQ